MRDNSRRQKALLAIIRVRAVRNQVEIVRRLQKTGIDVTQASVSRDIRELGLVKVKGRYGTPERMFGGGGERDGNGLITKIDAVGANLIVVRTLVGSANAVAVELDRMVVPEIVGTVAGDDTFFVAVKSRTAQGRVTALLKGMMRRA